MAANVSDSNLVIQQLIPYVRFETIKPIPCMICWDNMTSLTSNVAHQGERGQLLHPLHLKCAHDILSNNLHNCPICRVPIDPYLENTNYRARTLDDDGIFTLGTLLKVIGIAVIVLGCPLSLSFLRNEGYSLQNIIQAGSALTGAVVGLGHYTNDQILLHTHFTFMLSVCSVNGFSDDIGVLIALVTSVALSYFQANYHYYAVDRSQLFGIAASAIVVSALYSLASPTWNFENNMMVFTSLMIACYVALTVYFVTKEIFRARS